ncbi:hypothetical protein K493DRAFT_356121 [Basidiobolus meristosporus CBS 931.73]|uniref:Uncharacterized protein n=1 Tax=Basidiobolus meristosporus CBS 931.73 TaxID=1314790 RepID=A0A1Y1XZ65_9FUNG|nr:hypothetical protein K493DRAFT_356121 [Basidiobolus meristosporus CBS 931.73]|eukprot:ORX91019.1 hypothetical protein K493DRAFT_356121 [Basidiobolus meristosporus CBS 931.73]
MSGILIRQNVLRDKGGLENIDDFFGGRAKCGSRATITSPEPYGEADEGISNTNEMAAASGHLFPTQSTVDLLMHRAISKPGKRAVVGAKHPGQGPFNEENDQDGDQKNRENQSEASGLLAKRESFVRPPKVRQGPNVVSVVKEIVTSRGAPVAVQEKECQEEEYNDGPIDKIPTLGKKLNKLANIVAGLAKNMTITKPVKNQTFEFEKTFDEQDLMPKRNSGDNAVVGVGESWAYSKRKLTLSSGIFCEIRCLQSDCSYYQIYHPQPKGPSGRRASTQQIAANRKIMAESSHEYTSEHELFYKTNVHLVVNSVSLIIFWSTSYNSLLLVRQKASFSHAVCLFQSILGFVATLSNVLHSLMLDQDCVLGMYLNVVFYYLSSASVGWLLVLKAYALHSKSKAVILIGGILSLVKISLMAPTLIAMNVRSEPLCQLSLPQINIQATGLVDMGLLALCLFYFAQSSLRKSRHFKLRMKEALQKDGVVYFAIAAFLQFLGLTSVLGNSLWQGYFAIVSMTLLWSFYSKLLYEGLMHRMDSTSFVCTGDSSVDPTPRNAKQAGAYVVHIEDPDKQSIELGAIDADADVDDENKAIEIDDSQSQVKLTCPMALG